MAQDGLKCISYAFKEIQMSDLEQLTSTYDVESEEFRNELENDLIYLATFGMDDPLRPDIEESIQFIRHGSADAAESSGGN